MIRTRKTTSDDEDASDGKVQLSVANVDDEHGGDAARCLAASMNLTHDDFDDEDIVC
jgi:hypothetical protein